MTAATSSAAATATFDAASSAFAAAARSEDVAEVAAEIALGAEAVAAAADAGASVDVFCFATAVVAVFDATVVSAAAVAGGVVKGASSCCAPVTAVIEALSLILAWTFFVSTAPGRSNKSGSWKESMESPAFT